MDDTPPLLKAIAFPAIRCRWRTPLHVNVGHCYRCTARNVSRCGGALEAAE